MSKERWLARWEPTAMGCMLAQLLVTDFPSVKEKRQPSLLTHRLRFAGVSLSFCSRQNQSCSGPISFRQLLSWARWYQTGEKPTLVFHAERLIVEMIRSRLASKTGVENEWGWRWNQTGCEFTVAPAAEEQGKFITLCLNFLYVGKFPLEKKETLVSSLVFMSRTFLIALHSFLLAWEVLPLFSPFSSLHSAGICTCVCGQDTALGTEERAGRWAVVLSSVLWGRQMSLDSVARRAGGKAGTRERERKYGSGLCLSEGIPERSGIWGDAWEKNKLSPVPQFCEAGID